MPKEKAEQHMAVAVAAAAAIGVHGKAAMRAAEREVIIWTRGVERIRVVEAAGMVIGRLGPREGIRGVGLMGMVLGLGEGRGEGGVRLRV